jgi:hypothetical protein
MGKKTQPALVVSNRTRRRVSKLSTEDLSMHMETILGQSLPEAFHMWEKGADPKNMELTLEAVLGIWHELSVRNHSS